VRARPSSHPHPKQLQSPEPSRPAILLRPRGPVKGTTRQPPARRIQARRVQGPPPNPLDATIVHALLAPAIIRILGGWNSWAPAPLRRRIPASVSLRRDPHKARHRGRHYTFVRNALVTGPTHPGFPTSAIYSSESGSDERLAGPYNEAYESPGTYSSTTGREWWRGRMRIGSLDLLPTRTQASAPW
jgi:hypothetical protein